MTQAIRTLNSKGFTDYDILELMRSFRMKVTVEDITKLRTSIGLPTNEFEVLKYYKRNHKFKHLPCNKSVTIHRCPGYRCRKCGRHFPDDIIKEAKRYGFVILEEET